MIANSWLNSFPVRAYLPSPDAKLSIFALRRAKVHQHSSLAEEHTKALQNKQLGVYLAL
jgi:hypothetical protein